LPATGKPFIFAVMISMHQADALSLLAAFRLAGLLLRLGR
jgi:hypothetical protein